MMAYHSIIKWDYGSAEQSQLSVIVQALPYKKGVVKEGIYPHLQDAKLATAILESCNKIYPRTPILRHIPFASDGEHYPSDRCEGG